MSGERTRVWILFILMVLLAVAVGSTSIGVLYRAALEREKGHLLEIAVSQVRLIEAVARFDRNESADFPGGPVEATIAQVRDAHTQYKTFGETGEFVLGSQVGTNVVFILVHSGQALSSPETVPFGSKLAAPMQMALSGQTGTTVGLDYEGNRVLAGHAPVAELGLGIVVKKDLSEIRAPFFRAIVIAGLVGIALILLSTVGFLWVSTPIIASLQQANAELRDMLALRESMEAISRHDLKGPLGAIIALPEMLIEKDYLKEEDRKLLRVMTQGAERMLEVVNRSLRLVRMENGTYDFQLDHVDLAALVSDVFDETRHMAEAKQVRLELRGADKDAESGTALPLVADRELILTMLSHLVRNAVEAAPGATPVVVTLSKTSGIEIKIHNAGEVPISVRSRFFEKYITYGKKDGTGLGTYTAKLITDTLGGKITMSTGALTGTTVVVTLPAGVGSHPEIADV